MEQGDTIAAGEILGSVWAQEEDGAWFGTQAVLSGVSLDPDLFWGELAGTLTDDGLLPGCR